MALHALAACSQVANHGMAVAANTKHCFPCKSAGLQALDRIFLKRHGTFAMNASNAWRTSDVQDGRVTT